MGESEAPPSIVERVFSPVAAPRDDPSLDLNRAYASSQAMQRGGPMMFGGASASDASITRHLFDHADDSNMAAHEVFDKMTRAQYGDAEVHTYSYRHCRYFSYMWPPPNVVGVDIGH
jgi:hypothetical protein